MHAQAVLVPSLSDILGTLRELKAREQEIDGRLAHLIPSRATSPRRDRYRGALRNALAH